MNSVKINGIKVSGKSVERTESGYIIVVRRTTRSTKHTLTFKNEGSAAITVRTLKLRGYNTIVRELQPGDETTIEIGVGIYCNRDMRFGEFEVQLMSEGGPMDKPERVDQYKLYHGSSAS